MATKTISKAAMIRQRYAELEGVKGRVQLIAQEVGCSDAYVRVVARQRVYNGLSASDIRYRAKPEVVAARRPQLNAQQRRYYQRNIVRMREVKRLQYHKDRARALAETNEST